MKKLFSLLVLVSLTSFTNSILAFQIPASQPDSGIIHSSGNSSANNNSLQPNTNSNNSSAPQNRQTNDRVIIQTTVELVEDDSCATGCNSEVMLTKLGFQPYALFALGTIPLFPAFFARSSTNDVPPPAGPAGVVSPSTP